MMSACLVIAQNGRYGFLSTQATGVFARRWVSAACSRASSAYAVGSVKTWAASSIVGVLIRAPHFRGLTELDGCQVRSLCDGGHAREERSLSSLGTNVIVKGSPSGLRRCGG